MSESVEIVVDWIKENCLKNNSDVDITADTSLLVSNILDSIAFLSLVTYLEGRFQVKIDEDDMSPENFETPQTVMSLVDSLKSPQTH
jgi:acyl carrier protein